MNISELLNESNEWITPYLERVFDGVCLSKDDKTVSASMYSLMAGGKRFRPALIYYTAKMLGIPEASVAVYAVSLEMIHTYSLIHDDLPAMDNDDLRRGKPTCHKAYGENFAILAGDSLLNKAHELLLDDLTSGFDINRAKAASYLSRCAGIDGMIGGQSIDLSSEGTDISLDLLRKLQEMKTGALIRAGVVVPAIAAGCSSGIISLLEELADHMGLAFQIKDDLLDFESDSNTLGKSVGKDLRDNKSTFVTLLGIDGARQALIREHDLAFEILGKLAEFDYSTENYKIIVDYLVNRIN